MEKTLHETPFDWTANTDGTSNSSDEFYRLAGAVGDLIQSRAHDIVGGKADRVARLIVANLAHRHDLAPRTAVHRPDRLSDVVAWLKRRRDEFQADTGVDSTATMAVYLALDELLDDYRLHADTGTPLSEDVAGPHGGQAL